jgi:hypothetical protein
MVYLLLLTTLILFAEYYYRLFLNFDTIILLIIVSSFGIISILGLNNSIIAIKETNSIKNNRNKFKRWLYFTIYL